MKKYRIDEITINLDNRRKPLNNVERSKISIKKLYPYYGANNLMDYIDEYIFDEEILCVAEDGGNWGYKEKCSYIVNERCWVNNHAHVLKAKENLNLKFLNYYLNFNDLSNSIKGTTRGKLTKSALNSIEILLPYREIQNKIVNILDKAQSLIDKRKAQIESLDEIIKSVFYDMFGDPVSNTKGWDTGKIEDVIIKTQYGTSNKADEQNGKFKILRMNNIMYDGNWDFTNIKYIDLDEKEQKKYLVYKGEVLFNRTNSKELVGKTAVYTRDIPMAYAGYLIKAIPNNRSNGQFIANYMNTNYMKAVLVNMAKNIVGMANINAEEFKKINIYIPPIDLQNKFASIVESIEKQKEKLQES